MLMKIRLFALRSLLVSMVFLGAGLNAHGQSPILELTFDNTLDGVDGETPISSSGITFVDGIRGQAALFDDTATIVYESMSNIDSQVGTLDFVITPTWDGNDQITHEILVWNSLPSDNGGGMVFAKDGANNLRQYFNRFSQGGQTEIGTAINVNDWVAGESHYVTYSWSAIEERLLQYVDGELVDEQAFPENYFLPTITRPDFYIGANLSASLDELRIFDRELTAAEVQSRYNELFSIPEPSSPLLFLAACTIGFARKRHS